ncbi:MAG: type IV pilus biogenesis/stability protein PilW [Sandaracinaceae bacterium]
MERCARAAWMCLFVAAAYMPNQAAAQGSDTERARAEFMAGVACVQEHETACAEGHFRAAMALRDAPAVRYNLASALFELGRYPEAARLNRSVLADEETPETVRDAAQALAEQLETDGGTLEITVEGTRVDGSVEVDDEVIPESQLAATPVRVGAHRVHVTRNGAVAAETSVRVDAGQHVPVLLTLPLTAEEQAEVDRAQPSELGLLGDWRLWLGVGGAVAVIAIVITVAVLASENASLEEPLVGNTTPGVLRWD